LINEWDLTQTNLKRLIESPPEVAILPISAIEPHNQHLPEGQDWLHTTYIAKESTKRAWEEKQSVIYLPTIPYGVECNLMDFPLAINVSQTTLNAMVGDIIRSLFHHGIRKIVLINGHGGNNFGAFVREIQCELAVHVFLCNWWRVGLDKYDEIFDKPDDHAGEFETSVALALYPELVEYENAQNGFARPFRFEALNKGWVHTSRRFAKLNDHCACGDPADASAEKGQKYLDLVIERISSFLIELADSTIDEDFPHKAVTEV